MVTPQEGKRISKTDTYLNCAEANALLNCSRQQTIGADNYIAIPAVELEWLQK